MARWRESWSILSGTIESLSPADLEQTISIRGESHTVPQAIERQVSHYGYHAGQIVLIAKILVQRSGGAWEHLSIPPGQTGAFNAQMRSRHGGF